MIKTLIAKNLSIFRDERFFAYPGILLKFQGLLRS